jgi:threonine synthase
VWRYRAALALEGDAPAVTLGEGNTPLVEATWVGQAIRFKLEGLNPTGSFKDRGASVLVTALAAQGATHVVEDSSGNAGAALAAYTARAGLNCEVCVPATASGQKLAQIEAYGATIVPVQGLRQYATLAAWSAAAHGATYASHVYHPLYLEGTKTLAYELWEDLGERAPARVVVPVGHGTLVLGLLRGFQDLQAAGLIDRLPALVAVQAAACSPLAPAFAAGGHEPESVDPSPTQAEGIAIANPVRGAQILDAVRSTAGRVLTVAEREIQTSHRHLARAGFHVEPTAAVVGAALSHLPPADGTVVVLTGHGLKA